MRIVAAMSGGVDSSVTAGLLAEAGHEVIGVTLQLYDHGAAAGRKGACCAGRDIGDARDVADRLGIPHYVIDAEARFRRAVIDDFANSYAAGETPVPCVRCNQSVKFTDLLGLARELGADAMATGHYVRRVGRAVQLRPPWPRQAADVVAGGETVCAEIAGEAEEVGELHPLVARHAGDRRPSARIFVGEPGDDAVAEAALIIEDVMGKAESGGDRLRVGDVAPCAAGLGASGSRAVVVELEGDADHLRAGAGGERGHDRAVDAAGHGDDDPRLRGRLSEIEIDVHPAPPDRPHWRKSPPPPAPGFAARA